jgi:hypothetical protein
MRVWKITLIILIAVLIISGIMWWITTPRYIILNNKMSITLTKGASEDFIITPQKIKVTNLWKFRPLKIPITIENGEGDTTFNITDKKLPKVDSGYLSESKDYKFALSQNSISLVGNSEGKIYVTISDKNLEGGDKIEKSFAISQALGESGLSIGRSYILEILVK